MTWGSYGNDLGMTREYLGDSGRVRDITKSKCVTSTESIASKFILFFDNCALLSVVKNPGISYSEFLFLMPDSRTITSWSLYAIHIMKEGLDPYL